MSFRTRLSSFFVVIVLLPMIAMGVLVYRLISDSDQGKADARAAGLATAAASVYASAAQSARADAAALAREPALLRAHGRALDRLIAQAGLIRLVLTQGGRSLADVGDRTAIAPGTARVSFSSGRTPSLTVQVSSLPAGAYVRELTSSGAGVVVRAGGRTLAQSIDATSQRSFAPRAAVSIHAVRYREITQRFPGFGAGAVAVSTLSDLATSAAAGSSSRAIAIVFIAGFLLLALAFAVFSSRALQSQVTRFLHAARRLAAGDFSAPVPAEGNDEFAALAGEFNHMSEQLDRRLKELSDERARLRESVRRIGETFASNLDRDAVLALALKTALDATQSACGRVSVRGASDAPLSEVAREGALEGGESMFAEAEARALAEDGPEASQTGETHVIAAALRPVHAGGRAHGLIAVSRERPFAAEEIDVLRSLAGQAALALENIELHKQVSRQAVTDELTGLANHGRFQELLGADAEQVRRYRYPLGLIMLDLDNFKSINDTYGHQQGDLVLRHVGAVLQENSRDADSPARYGGEELALILPHTDLEGAFAIAERVRCAIGELRIPRVSGGEPLRVTASMGVAASIDGDKDALIAGADAALYEAKRTGKNRTVRAPAPTADVVGAE